MRIHHLNCASLCAPFPYFTAGSGGMRGRTPLVAHCLLVETPAHGLVLIDTGFGRDDCTHMRERFGSMFMWSIGQPSGTADSDAVNRRLRLCAIEQIQALGFQPSDVRHIVVTHLDLDHAGGIQDFPHARVHVMRAEFEAAHATGFIARERYKKFQWEHHTDFAFYDAAQGEKWRGLSRVRALDGLPPEFLMLPLRGHTEGHAAVAVEHPNGAIVYAGDAYFHRSSVAPTTRPTPNGMLAYEWLLAVDKSALRDNHERLRKLAMSGDVELFCAHDPGELPGPVVL